MSLIVYSTPLKKLLPLIIVWSVQETVKKLLTTLLNYHQNFETFFNISSTYFRVVLCLCWRLGLNIDNLMWRAADILVLLSVCSHVMTPVPSTLSYVMSSPNYAVKLFNIFQYFLPFQYS